MPGRSSQTIGDATGITGITAGIIGATTGTITMGTASGMADMGAGE
jgi:hypothetical protein